MTPRRAREVRVFARRGKGRPVAADAPAARRTGVRRVGRDTRMGAESERIREHDRRGGEGEEDHGDRGLSA